jgi:hypothetical protein
MKKLAFLLGVVVGFLLGSKFGHEPYAQMEKKVREVAARPEVHDAMTKAKGAASAQFGQLSEKVSDKLPSSSGADGARSGGDSTRSSVLQRSGT